MFGNRVLGECYIDGVNSERAASIAAIKAAAARAREELMKAIAGPHGLENWSPPVPIVRASPVLSGSLVRGSY